MTDLANANLNGGNLAEFFQTFGTLSVVAPGMATTAYKLSVPQGNVRNYGTLRFTWTTQELHIRWYEHHNTLASSSGTAFPRTLRLINTTTSSLIFENPHTVPFGGTSYIHQMRTVDDVSQVDTATTPVSNGIHLMEFVMTRADTSISVNGSFKYFIDGVVRASQSSKDFFDRAPSGTTFELQIGLPFGENANLIGTVFLDEVVVRQTAKNAANIGIYQVVDPSVNILTADAGTDLTTWSAVEGASKGTSNVTFTQEASGVPGRVEYTFLPGRFALNTAHRFTGLLIPTTLNYEHTDIKWFVRNDTTGAVKFHQMTFDHHSDKGGQSEIGERKPFNIVFYSTSLTDQFTVGFENLANNQLGCTFTVSNLGVFIVV